MNKELKLKWHSIYGQIIFDRKLMAAWRNVEKNGGAGGIDGETIDSFKEHEEDKIADLLAEAQNQNIQADSSTPPIYTQEKRQTGPVGYF